MYVSKLHVFSYRNISELSAQFSEGLHCIVGKNGVGKTNLLDSIYYLSYCKSNIATSDVQNVKSGANFFSVQGYFSHADSIEKVGATYNLEAKEKTIYSNDKKYAKFSEHIGKFPLIFVSPADIALINSGAAERRKLLDSFISLFDSEYLSSLLTYNKLLSQRNAYLKHHAIDYSYLEVIDHSLVQVGNVIHATRIKVVAELQAVTSDIYTKLAPTESCKLVYESQLLSQDFAKGLQQCFEKDKILTHSSYGIHRDDVLFMFNENLLKLEGSQGQKKTFLLALKLAQYRIIAQKKNVLPILLLDDLFDKLDKERTERVFDVISEEKFGQTFITDTDKMLLHSFFEAKQQLGSFYTLEQGNLVEIPQ